MLSDRCHVCLPVTLVYCGQTVGCIKMKLDMQVGFSPGDIVLDGTQLTLPQRGTAPRFRPMSVVAKWLDASTCQLVGGRQLPKRHCARWGPRSTARKRGLSSPSFWPMSVVANSRPSQILLSFCRICCANLQSSLHVVDRL